MHRPLIAAVLLAGAAACSRASEGTEEKLDAVLARLETIDGRLAALEKRPAGATGAAAAAPPRRGPDPNTIYAVPVDDGDLYLGPKHAKVTIVEAYEYACPYCKMVSGVVKEVLARRPKDVKVVQKQFVVHPQIATSASLAVCAANKQGKFAAMSDAIWSSAWTEDAKLDKEKLAPEALVALARQAGLDVEKFKADLAGDACKQEIAQDQREMQAIGVNGTPAFFVNGKPYVGPRTVEGFLQVVDAEIKKADDALAAGARLEDYYASVIRAGKKSL